MKTARVSSRCECQARLEATLDENGVVLHGRATPAHGGEPESAPATAMGVGQDQFQVGWLCNLCHRNTVRSFYKGALVFRESDVEPKAAS